MGSPALGEGIGRPWRGLAGGAEVPRSEWGALHQPTYPFHSDLTAALMGPHQCPSGPPPLPPPHRLRTPPRPDGGRASPAAAKGPRSLARSGTQSPSLQVLWLQMLQLRGHHGLPLSERKLQPWPSRRPAPPCRPPPMTTTQRPSSPPQRGGEGARSAPRSSLSLSYGMWRSVRDWTLRGCWPGPGPRASSFRITK